MASDKDNIQFTIEVETLASFLLADPRARKELLKAIVSKAKCDPTKPCGSANLGTVEEPEWFSFFMATDRAGKEPGDEGFLWRTTSGKRVCARLRRQTAKAQVAETEVLDEPVEGAELLQAALDGDAESAQAILDKLETTSVV